MIYSYVKKVEIGKAIRETNANMELVECYWNVGRLIVEAQGGKEKAKYGNELIKTWAEKLTEEYGKGYNYTNLSRFVINQNYRVHYVFIDIFMQRNCIHCHYFLNILIFSALLNK